MKILNNPRTPITIVTTLIFLVDFLMPPGSAIGVLYVIPMTMAFKLRQKIVTSLAIICTSLIALDGLLFYELYAHYSIYIDRAVAILAIWLSSFVVLRYRALRLKSEEQKKKQLKTIIELLFITSHKMRRPVSNLQGLKIISDFDTVTKKDLKKIFRSIEESVIEIDVFTKELTGYLVNLKESEEFGSAVESAEMSAELKTIKLDHSKFVVLKNETYFQKAI
jgi:hypothetical protein